MGVFKKYAPCIMCDGLRLDDLSIGQPSQQKRPVPTWHDINGNAYTDILATYNPNGTNRVTEFWRNISSFATSFLDPVATRDILDDYDVNDYGITEIGTTTKSNSITKSTNSIENIYNVRITNNAPSENSYILNSDPIWRTYNEYYSRSGEEGSYIYTRVTNKPSDFATTYNTYYVLEATGAIVVKCIKFKKGLYTGTAGSATVNERITLYCAYFLDESEWITIPAGESRNIVVDFAAIVA